MSNFRLSGKQFFLTYPQCPLDPEVVLAQLRDKVVPEIVAYVIAREQHEDGNFHIHAYLKYDRKVSVTNQSKFDLLGEEGEGYHGNYQTCRSARAVIKYCEKGGTYIAEGVEVGKQSDWSEAVEMARGGDAEGALAMLWSRQARTMLLSGDRVAMNMRSQCAQVYASPSDLSPWRLPVHLCSVWPRLAEERAIILTGPPGLGKTRWARSLGPHLYVTHMDDLKRLLPSIKLIIFDDMDFSHWPPSSIIHLTTTSDEVSVHVRYTTATIPAKVSRIFLTNLSAEELFQASRFPDPQWQAVMRRITVVEINDKLY